MSVEFSQLEWNAATIDDTEDAARRLTARIDEAPEVQSVFVYSDGSDVTEARVAEQRVLAELASPAYVLATVDRDDLRACTALISRYAGIGVADASMLVLADRLGIDRVLTLDRRHFEAARTPAGRALSIVP